MEFRNFELVSKYKPTGDQPEAIASLVEGLNDGLAAQVLKGVTGSGKTQAGHSAQQRADAAGTGRTSPPGKADAGRTGQNEKWADRGENE